MSAKNLLSGLVEISSESEKKCPISSSNGDYDGSKKICPFGFHLLKSDAVRKMSDEIKLAEKMNAFENASPRSKSSLFDRNEVI